MTATARPPDWSIVAEGLGKRYLLTRGPVPTSFGALRRRRRDTQAGTRSLWALRDVSFSVAEGTTLGVVGRNGAGKTTLLKTLTGVTLPTEGRALMRGRVVPLLAVGAGYHPDLTGRQNIRLSAAFIGIGRDAVDRRMDAILDIAEVDPTLLDLRVRQYERSSYVRLAFAAAVVLEPDVLLADEILAAGDSDFRERALSRMAEASPSQTIVFVSHDMSAVTRLCTRVLWLDDGRIVDDGEPSEVVARYKDSIRRPQRAGAAPPARPPTSSSGAVALERVETLDPNGEPAASVTHDEPGAVAVHWRALEPGLRVRVAVGLLQGDALALRDESPERAVDEAGTFRTTVALPARLLARARYRVAVTITATREGEPAGKARGETWLTVSHADRGAPSRPALAEPDLSWSVS